MRVSFGLSVQVGLLLCLMFAGQSIRADDGPWLLSYSTARLSGSGEIIREDNLPGKPFFAFGDGSLGNKTNYGFEYEFNEYFGALYKHESATLNSFAASTHMPGVVHSCQCIGSYSGNVFAAEGRYPLGVKWLEGLARINYWRYSVETTGSVTPSTPLNTFVSSSFSGSTTFLSLGLRLKISHHFGLELVEDHYGGPFAAATSIGLYFQF